MGLDKSDTRGLSPCLLLLSYRLPWGHGDDIPNGNWSQLKQISDQLLDTVSRNLLAH